MPEETTIKPKILAVDDENNILDVIELYLLREGFQVLRATDGPTALSLFEKHRPDLVLLDIMIPILDGLEVLKLMRVQTPAPPILLLTARGQEEDKLAGLEGGADDYITKPFSPRELVARVKVALRRVSEQGGRVSTRTATDEILVFGNLKVNKTARAVEVGGQPVNLTAKEFDLLW